MDILEQENVFDAVKQVCGTYIKAIEIFSLIYDLRMVTRQGYYQSQMPKVRDLCYKQNLYLLESEFGLLNKDSAIFSDKGIITGKKNPNAMIFVYISKEEDIARKAYAYEQEQNFEELGKLLGYPDCCISFFKKNFEGFYQDSRFFLKKSFANSKGMVFPFYNNLFLRYNGYAIISHFPCRFNCNQSTQTGAKNIKILEKINSHISKHIIQMLKCRVIIGSQELSFI